MTGLRSHGNGVLLTVQVRAGARRRKIQRMEDGRWKVFVTEAPEKGKANAAVIALLSQRLRVAKSRIELVSGRTAPCKQLLIKGLSAVQVRRGLP